MTESPAEKLSPKGYASGRATKLEIIKRASEAFSQQGFHGTSLRSIARSANVDHSTLIHHFGNKTKLLRAVLEWHDGHAMDAQASMPSSAKELAAGMIELARYNQTVPGLVQLHSMLSAEATTEDHPARNYLQLRHKILLDVLGSAVQQQRDAGAVANNGLTAQQCAAMIISTWEGLQVFDTLNPGVIDIPSLLEKVFSDAFGLK